MQEHLRIGKYGEGLACLFLKEKGFTIIETNWRFSRAEIDIIARKANLMVFFEVKTRSYTFYGEPEEAVGEKKEQMMFNAAGMYMEQMNLKIPIRFDIIAVHLKGSTNYKITHFEDAFF